MQDHFICSDRFKKEKAGMELIETLTRENEMLKMASQKLKKENDELKQKLQTFEINQQQAV